MNKIIEELEINDNRTYIRTVIVILCIMIGILFATIAFDVIELQSCTEPIEAEYVDLKRNGQNGARAYYTYTYGGEMYRHVGATHTVNFGQDREIGEIYTIYVSPNDPTCFKTISGDISLTVFLRFIVCVVFGFLVSYMLSFIRKPDFVVYHKEYPLGRAVMKDFNDIERTDV